MNINQLHDNLYQPMANAMNCERPSRFMIICMLAAHESHWFEYYWQEGGPAVSPFQIEMVRAVDVFENYSKFTEHFGAVFGNYPHACNVGFFQYSSYVDEEKLKTELATNLRLAMFFVLCAMLNDSDPLPEEDLQNPKAWAWECAKWCKDKWNTSAGKATPQKYYDDLMLHGGGIRAVYQAMGIKWNGEEWQAPAHNELIGGSGASD